VITELDEGNTYADRTHYDGLILAFRYTLADLPDGGTRLSHRLIIDGPELGPQITGTSRPTSTS